MQRTAILVTAAAVLMTATFATAQRLPPKPSGPAAMDRQAPSTEPAVAAARRITREDAIKLVREEKAVYVDVRSKDSYDKGHIKGALSIPNSQLLSRLKELPQGKTVITYCACVKEHTAAVAVVNLNSAGFRNTAALVGGWDEWVALGLPIEKTKK
ncbi:MAG TPA: rhodanese-like domain-containing protein [Thermoanaerobaculia bacterium]|nr:rhodanese-like domain-containing protein [Thermoanaerobaculia bacterium]